MYRNIHLENMFMVASFLSFLLVISAVRNKNLKLTAIAWAQEQGSKFLPGQTLI